MALKFVVYSDTGKTKVWVVESPGGERLGQIRWMSQWRRYCFYPDSGTLYDADCLGTIVSFIMARMKERKE